MNKSCITGCLEALCPAGWTIEMETVNSAVFRTRQLLSPNGLRVEVEYFGYTAEARVVLDSFAFPLLQRRLGDAKDKLAGVVEARESSNAWETRISSWSAPDVSTPLLVSAADPDGIKVDGVPAVALDCIAAVGTVLAVSILPEDWGATSAESSVALAIGLPEGGALQLLLNRYERDPRNRAAAIKFHGTRCAACGMDMGERYGPIAAGFIHIHHLTPLSEMVPGYVVDPINDLVPLCPNCHSVAHRRVPALSVEELSGLTNGD